MYLQHERGKYHFLCRVKCSEPVSQQSQAQRCEALLNMVVLTMLSFGTSPMACSAAVAAVAFACFLLRLAKVGLYSLPLTLTWHRGTRG